MRKGKKVSADLPDQDLDIEIGSTQQKILKLESQIVGATNYIVNVKAEIVELKAELGDHKIEQKKR
jgi:hypothetical protein